MAFIIILFLTERLVLNPTLTVNPLFFILEPDMLDLLRRLAIRLQHLDIRADEQNHTKCASKVAWL